LKKFAQRFPLQLFGEKFKEVTLQKVLVAKQFSKATVDRKSLQKLLHHLASKKPF